MFCAYFCGFKISRCCCWALTNELKCLENGLLFPVALFSGNFVFETTWLDMCQAYVVNRKAYNFTAVERATTPLDAREDFRMLAQLKQQI